MVSLRSASGVAEAPHSASRRTRLGPPPASSARVGLVRSSSNDPKRWAEASMAPRAGKRNAHAEAARSRSEGVSRPSGAMAARSRSEGVSRPSGAGMEHRLDGHLTCGLAGKRREPCPAHHEAARERGLGGDERREHEHRAHRARRERLGGPGALRGPRSGPPPRSSKIESPGIAPRTTLRPRRSFMPSSSLPARSSPGAPRSAVAVTMWAEGGISAARPVTDHPRWSAGVGRL